MTVLYEWTFSFMCQMIVPLCFEPFAWWNRPLRILTDRQFKDWKFETGLQSRDHVAHISPNLRWDKICHDLKTCFALFFCAAVVVVVALVFVVVVVTICRGNLIRVLTLLECYDKSVNLFITKPCCSKRSEGTIFVLSS